MRIYVLTHFQRYSITVCGYVVDFEKWCFIANGASDGNNDPTSCCVVTELDEKYDDFATGLALNLFWVGIIRPRCISCIGIVLRGTASLVNGTLPHDHLQRLLCDVIRDRT